MFAMERCTVSASVSSPILLLSYSGVEFPSDAGEEAAVHGLLVDMLLNILIPGADITFWSRVFMLLSKVAT